MAGNLRNKVELLMRDDSVDAYGDRSEQYLTVGFRWCEVKELSGRELAVEGVQASEVGARVVMRSDSLTRTLRGDDALGYNGKVYRIQSISERDNKGRFLEIGCVKDDR